MNTRLTTVAAVLLVGLAGIAAPLGAASVAAQSGPAVGFGDARTTVAQGDVAAIDLQLRNTDQAILRIQSSDQQYRATLRVRDGDGDGTVTVRANTFRGAGLDDADRFTAGDDADTARLLAESTPSDAAVLDTGRYNLIVSTAETSVAAVLTIEVPTADGSDVQVVAPETSLDGTDAEAATDAEPTEVDSTVGDTAAPVSAARGDWVRTRFNVTGVGGVLTSPAPADNLVFAADSTPGEQTIHTLQTTPDESISTRSVTIDYGADDGTPPASVARFSRGDIETIGIDEAGDGYVDRSVAVAIQSIRTSTDGRLTVSFDRPITISENHTLLMTYVMENPNTTGSEPVTVELHGGETTHRSIGSVLYGPAGQGTLGHGVDLRLTNADGNSPVAPLAAVEATYDADTDGVVATTDTSAFATDEYAVTFSVGEAAPEPVPSVSLREPFAVVEPTAEFTDSSVSDDSRLSVTADTNLAPDNSIIVRVEAEELDGGISQQLNCVATVESDGSIGCEFDLSKPADDFDVTVTIQRNDSVIAGPTRFN